MTKKFVDSGFKLEVLAEAKHKAILLDREQLLSKTSLRDKKTGQKTITCIFNQDPGLRR